MMNRGIMSRQMFRQGGAAFPDLSGDGQVTQRDILMGRGVLPKPMQAGGMMPPQAQMMAPPPPPEAMMAPPPAAMMPPPPPPEAMMPPPPQEEMSGVGGLQEESGVDPAMLEQFMAEAAQNFGDLETAEDYEDMINRLRGDQMPIAGRRQELAGFVGPEDAQITPESVLAMVQPVIMLAGTEVDEGIGGLAQEQMMEPVTGDMAGGIMSTVAGVEEAPAPVNFRQGGAVQKFANTNANRVAGDPAGILESDLGKSFQERRDLYNALIPPVYGAEDLAEQKRLTEGNMFFDIARAGLALAQPGKRSESLAQSIARAAQDSKVFENLGARSQQMRDLELKGKLEDRKVDIAALSAAESEEAARLKAESDARLKGMKFQSGLVTIFDPKGNPVPGFVETKIPELLIAQFGKVGYTAKIIGSAESAGKVSIINLTRKAGPLELEGVTYPAEIAVDASNNQEIQKLIDNGYLKAGAVTGSTGKPSFQNFGSPAGGSTTFNGQTYDQSTTIDINDPNNIPLINHLTSKGWVEQGLLAFDTQRTAERNLNNLFPGGSAVEKFQFAIGDPELVNLYASGELDKIADYKESGISGGQVSGFLTQMMQEFYRPKMSENKATGNIEFTSTLEPTPNLVQAIENRKQAQLLYPELNKEIEPNAVPVKIDPILLANKQNLFKGNEDLAAVVGVRGGFNAFVDTIQSEFDNVAGVFGLNNFYKAYDEKNEATQKAAAALSDLARRIIEKSRDEIEGRVLKLDLELLQEEVNKFKPDRATSAQGALAQLKVLQKRFIDRYDQVNRFLANPSRFPAEQEKAKRIQANTETLVGEISAAIYLFENNLNPNRSTDDEKQDEPTIIFQKGGKITVP